MSLELPARPNLEHLKKQAKDLLRTLQQSDAAAKLADAQHQLARDYGFASWPKLKEHVDLLSLTPAELLTAAIRASDAARTARVLETYPELKAHLNEPLANYGDGMQPILAAVQRTDHKTIDVLLQAGANMNARSLTWGIGVLDECSPDFAPFLVERGAVVDVHAAARLGMLEALEKLVTSNPDLVHARGAGGQTPLHFASTVDVAEVLLEKGGEIDAVDVRHESTPAQYMIRVAQARYYPRDRQDIARHLIARGCRTDILMAAALGDLDLVRRHLDSDPNSIRMRVDEQYFPKQGARSEGTIYIEIFGRNRTPHLVARDFNHEQVFRLLMDRSPEDVKLSQAFELGDESIFDAMLAAHPNLVANLSDQDRRQLPDAAQNNNTAAVRLMLAAGWPVETAGEMGLTALQWSSWHGNAEMVKEILHYHPQIDRKDSTHDISALGSALHGSENSWHRDTGDYAATVQALLDAGAKAPKLTDDLEASEAVREVLARHEEVLNDATR
jgi:ankyrin repeat protein